MIKDKQKYLLNKEKFRKELNKYVGEDKYIAHIKTEKTGESGEIADWEEYTAPITLTRNQKIYVKLIDRNSNEIVEEGQTIGNVEKIDKLPPKDFATNVTYTTNSITIIVSTTDQEATDDYGCSGLYGYRFSID